MNISLDGIDLQILETFDVNGRISVSELSQQIGMSAPSISERIRRLEDRGVIKNFSVNVDVFSLGYNFEAIVRIKPRPGALQTVEKMIVEQPRFTACDRVTGDDCFVARLVLKSVQELEDLLDPLHEKAETNTSIVQSSPIKNRNPIIHNRPA